MKCKQCNEDLVWIGSLKAGKLDCLECKKNIPQFEFHVQGQNMANSEEWINVYKHEGDEK